jgi:hypothetical protein
MKYTIETMENGYVETLEIGGKFYVKTWESTEQGTYRCKEGDFTDRIIADGVVPEAYEDDLYDAVDDHICGLDMYCFERDYMGD